MFQLHWGQVSLNVKGMHIKLIVTLLDSLGFVVHPDKSIFEPARLSEYLGF